LSVQVHPDDARAKEWENSRGKTEMWRILRAEPGASIALGFKEELTPERAAAAARTGEIEHLLRWIPVTPGEIYFVPAGTVHAIGAGIALCEVQQNSDVTYRLYDYNRPRELHLEKGFAVSDLGPYLGGAVTGVQCEYFGAEEFRLAGRLSYSGGRGGRALLILTGSGALNGKAMTGGEGWWIPGGLRVDIDAPSGMDVLEVRQP
jgi:mannose-6-phosphate isomerase